MPDENDQNTEVNMEKLEQDLLEALNGWKRTQADFENYKRRKEAENKELLEFAKEVTVAKLLPTIDALEQALKHLPEYVVISPPHEEGLGEVLGSDQLSSKPTMAPSSSPSRGGEALQDFAKKYQNWQTGINGIVMQLDKVLGELGVKKIEALGKKFDPHLHEAVREVASDVDECTIVEELQSGFELNGKVIRPSQVVISKKK